MYLEIPLLGPFFGCIGVGVNQGISSNVGALWLLLAGENGSMLALENLIGDQEGLPIGFTGWQCGVDSCVCMA